MELSRTACKIQGNDFELIPTVKNGNYTSRRGRRHFQAVFPVITGSFPTNVIPHLHALSMDLTVGRTVGPTVDSTVG